MNYTQNKLNLKTLFSFLLVVLFTNVTVLAKRASADMMAREAMAPMPTYASPVSETIAFYIKKQRTQKLNENEVNILKLSELAQDVFDIKNFMIAEHLKNEKEKAITTAYIANAIQQAIEKKSSWDDALSGSKLELVKANSDLLKTSLNESSYSWAWISYQTGQKEEAKKILASKFETAYETVMKLQHVYSHRSSPMEEAERLAKPLKFLSTDDENKTREAKLKKMRTHVSTLPDMQIMT